MTQLVKLLPFCRKLCVESVLPPVPEPSDPSDPYHFSLRETQGSPAHRSAITSSETETFRSSPVIAEPSLTSNSTSLRTATNALVNSSSKSSQSKLGKIYRSAKGKQNKDNVANAGHPNTNHINRTLNTTCSVSTVQRCNVVDSVVSVSSTPLTQPTKRKRSSYVVARKCGPIVTSAVTASTVQKNSHTGASNAQVTTAQPSPSTGFLSLSFPIPISAHLAATVPHLGATKNGSVPGVVTPVCGATIQSARNHATSGTVHSLKDLNVTVTGVELINGQLGPNSGTILTRPTSTPCIPVTTADTIRSSLSSLGLGYTTSTLTLTTSSNLVTSLSGGSCRASVSPSSTCFATSTSVSSMSSSSVTSGTKEVRMSSAKRGKSSSFSIKSSRPIHSASVTAPSISSSTSKWNIVNNTAVLTGLGALSNATLLSGAHAPSSQLTINAVGGSSLSPPQSGIGCSSSFRTVRMQFGTVLN